MDPQRGPGAFMSGFWRGQRLLSGALVAVAAGAPAVFGPGRRRRESLAQAEQARQDAAQAFVDLDQAQKVLDVQVHDYVALEPRRALPLSQEYAPFEAQTDAAIRGYLAALDEHAVDEGTPPLALQQGIAALNAARQELVRARSALEGFAQRSSDALVRSEQELVAVARQVADARAVLAGAQATAAAAATAGLVSGAMSASLAQAQQLAARLAPGPHALGIEGTAHLAAQLSAVAGAVVTAAEQLPVDRDHFRHDVSSLRTRMQVVESHIETVEPALSVLRRNYSTNCFEDVEGADRIARELLAAGREQLALADASAAGGDYPAALEAAQRARDQLRRAQDAADSPPRRLALLSRAATDPHATSEPARFALRDAQRLVQAQGQLAHPAWSRRLDTAVLQLEAAEQALSPAGRRDYAAFLQAMDVATSTAAEVVAAVRERTRTPR